ncbi:uncharacterized protein Z518_00629 [Rhinocladiella mackenziei CBS 650.93]|uniref:Glycosyltransferase family 28 N-terminal domain-containing protein n=1 Tax=Rhinocladiella mackenziei CBS 650.93 TaxID=1442369 RepID=A0A0D2IU12_9EURO|nr:uncharacterized protein Z518_00629 [Rhinocladiella mackenziei CBS 650.93]KIX09549.1 hypothetical protein Z518_00629 [Rhinocladiella mackenziei CBS 650.93]
MSPPQTSEDTDQEDHNYQDIASLCPPLFYPSNRCTTRTDIDDNGSIGIDIKQSNTVFSDHLAPHVQAQLQQAIHADDARLERPSLPGVSAEISQHPLHLNIVIQVVGSRGDIQPFVALGKTLREIYGHRVRIATHAAFKSLVQREGLEFFCIGGNPEALMKFMVKNPGLLPHYEALRSGDVLKQRKCLYEVLKGCWRSCIEAGDGMGPRPRNEDYAGLREWSSTETNAKPFVADVIIANPPSFAHVHCAERLGIPLHLMFTMPWTPTQAFPHPLTTLRSSNVDRGLANLISYFLVENIIWHGLGDVINLFRWRCLHLEPLSIMWAPGISQRLRLHFTYAWSPALLAKPPDWGPNISVAGYFQLPPLASPPEVPDELLRFLADGPPPIYIGFGSIVVRDPGAMTKIIFDAIAEAGVRAIVSVGWAGLGGEDIPQDVHLISDIPHSWLFERVSAVVHHGGAGTTAAGLMAGKPTVIIPFFGDQHFWGKIVAQTGAGPRPIPYKALTAKALAAAISQALLPPMVATARCLSDQIRHEHGCETGAEIFHAKLPLSKLRCSVVPHHAAIWKVKRTQIRLCSLAATTLCKEGLLQKDDLELYRSQEYELEGGPWDPISGTITTLLGAFGRLTQEFVDLPIHLVQTFQPPNPEHQGPCGLFPEGDGISHADEPRSPGTTSSATSPKPSATLSAADKAAQRHNSRHFGVPESFRRRLLKKQLEAELCGSFGRRASLRRHQHDHHFLHKGGPKALLQTIRDISLDVSSNIASSFANIAGAGLGFPVTLTMSLALGFHNAPKLYGDRTVRPPPSTHVTNFTRGLKNGLHEFWNEMSDAVTGIIFLPLHGARDDGIVGFTRGIGMGAGGLALKPMAAIFGFPAYTLSGLHKELQKRNILDFTAYIDAARTAQGRDEWDRATDEEKKEIIKRWGELVRDHVEGQKSKRATLWNRRSVF